ncbi:MAG: hypothetical protein WCC41_05865 [Rhodomicrobium sp.]
MSIFAMSHAILCYKTQSKAPAFAHAGGAAVRILSIDQWCLMDEAELQKAGYDVPVSKPPGAAEVAARAIILRHVAVYALIQPSKEALLQSMEGLTIAELYEFAWQNHRSPRAGRHLRA